MLSKEELRAIGVNPDNMVYPHGEMNIIVNCFGHDNAEDSVYYPDIYQPRKKSCIFLRLYGRWLRYV